MLEVSNIRFDNRPVCWTDPHNLRLTVKRSMIWKAKQIIKSWDLTIRSYNAKFCKVMEKEQLYRVAGRSDVTWIRTIWDEEGRHAQPLAVEVISISVKQMQKSTCGRWLDGVEHGGLLIPGFSSQKPYHHYSTLHTKQICVLLITLPKQIPILNNSTKKRHLISFVCPASTRWGNQSS